MTKKSKSPLGRRRRLLTQPKWCRAVPELTARWLKKDKRGGKEVKYWAERNIVLTGKGGKTGERDNENREENQGQSINSGIRSPEERKYIDSVSGRGLPPPFS